MSHDEVGETGAPNVEMHPSVTDTNHVSLSLDSLGAIGVSETAVPAYDNHSLMLTEPLLYQGGINLELEDWLTNENFGDALHNWPFVIDGDDIPPSSEAVPCIEVKSSCRPEKLLVHSS